MAVLLNNTPFTISHLQPLITISNELLLKQRHKPMMLTMLKIGHLVRPKFSDLCSHYFELMNAFSFFPVPLLNFMCAKNPFTIPTTIPVVAGFSPTQDEGKTEKSINKFSAFSLAIWKLALTILNPQYAATPFRYRAIDIFRPNPIVNPLKFES